MRYKKYMTQTKLAKLFGYSNLSSFSSSTAHHRIMRGIEKLLEVVETNQSPLLKELEELITKYKP
jgi:hypothetical protein